MKVHPADGVKSVVRRKILPHVRPAPPTGNCAYREIVPYSKVRADPDLRGLVEKLTMEVWMADKSYIISYPISAGKDFNMVPSVKRWPLLVTGSLDTWSSPDGTHGVAAHRHGVVLIPFLQRCGAFNG